jgi:hypothetical protein
MKTTVNLELTEVQTAVLSTVARHLNIRLEDVIAEFLTLLTKQAMPIYHLTNLLVSYQNVLPSFIEAVEESKEPKINLGELFAVLLKEIFSDDKISNELEKVRGYFMDDYVSGNSDVVDSATSSLGNGAVNIDEIIQKIEQEKRKKSEGNNT